MINNAKKDKIDKNSIEDLEEKDFLDDIESYEKLLKFIKSKQGTNFFPTNTLNNIMVTAEDEEDFKKTSVCQI